MSTPFSQTTRSLDADTLRGALFAWVPAFMVLAAWGAWFTGSTVDEVAVSQQARVDTATGPHARLQIVAEFAAAGATGRLQPGQPARLRLDGARTDLAARVTQVAEPVRDGRVRVELEPLPGGAATLREGLTGVAEVSVGQATPAALLARALGGPAAGAHGR